MARLKDVCNTRRRLDARGNGLYRGRGRSQQRAPLVHSAEDDLPDESFAFTKTRLRRAIIPVNASSPLEKDKVYGTVSIGNTPQRATVALTPRGMGRILR